MAETLVTELSFLKQLYAALAARFKIKWNTKDSKKKNVIHLEILTVAGQPVAQFSQVRADGKRKTKLQLAQQALNHLQANSS